MKTGRIPPRVTFVAARDLVAKALGEGWSARAIYNDRRHDELSGISYRQFARYCRQLRQPGQSVRAKPETAPGQPPTQPKQPVPDVQKTVSSPSTPQSGTDDVSRDKRKYRLGYADPETMRKLTRG